MIKTKIKYFGEKNKKGERENEYKCIVHEDIHCYY